MVTEALSSLVPWPNELSFLPLVMSLPIARFGARLATGQRPVNVAIGSLHQSVLGAVLTSILPSLPSKVLPVSGAPSTSEAPSRLTIVTTAPKASQRVLARGA